MVEPQFKLLHSDSTTSAPKQYTVLPLKKLIHKIYLLKIATNQQERENTMQNWVTGMNRQFTEDVVGCGRKKTGGRVC